MELLETSTLLPELPTALVLEGLCLSLPFLKVKNGAAPYSVHLNCPILVWQITEYTAHSAKQTVIGIAAMAPGGKSGPHRHHTRPHRRFVWGTKPPKARGHGSPGTRVFMVTMPHVPHTCRARNECRRPGCGPPFGKRTAAIELGRPCRHHRYRVCSARGRHSICRLLSANAAAFRAAGSCWAPLGGNLPVDAPNGMNADRAHPQHPHLQ